MLSTELISIPTGFTFLCGLMTLWRGQIRYTVPMLFCLAWFFNFLIGGLSGVFLSDVPSDVTTHGSFFSMAHFHYTIMGGLIFTFFAAIYYWVPKMTGFTAERAAGEDPLLVDVRRVQLDVRAAVRRRLPRPAAPRRHLPAEPPVPERLGLGLGVHPRAVDAVLPLQLRLLAAVRASPGGQQPVAARSRSSGSCRRRCRSTTSTGSRSSRAIRTTTAEAAAPVAVPAGAPAREG